MPLSRRPSRPRCGLESTAARLPKASSTSRQCAAPPVHSAVAKSRILSNRRSGASCELAGLVYRHPFTLDLCAAGAHSRYSLPLSCACIDALPPALIHGIDAGSSAADAWVIRALLSEPTMRAARHSLSQPSRNSQSVERPPPLPAGSAADWCPSHPHAAQADQCPCRLSTQTRQSYRAAHSSASSPP